jgi:hypothetical protein
MIARLGAIAALATWIVANPLRCAQVTTASQYVPQATEAMHGYRLAIWGWLGPLGLSVAWYAQIPFFYCVWNLFHGRARWRASMVALGLAATALLPHTIYSEVDGWHRAYFIGPAIWVWLSAFAIAMAATGILARTAENKQLKAEA